MRIALCLALVAVSACLPQARSRLRADQSTLERYQREVIVGLTLEQVDAYLTTLPEAKPYCLSFDTPCLQTRYQVAGRAMGFCLQWANLACFNATEVDGGVLVRPAGPETDRWTDIERALYQAIDPRFAERRTEYERAADAEVLTQPAPMSKPNSFWVQVRGTVDWPALGLQGQGGYRRWLNEYLIVAAGAGYERRFASFGGGALVRDAALITARFELSAYSEETQRRTLGLPLISGYFGFTAAVGLARDAGWTGRSFVGLSCLWPLSFEIGASMTQRPGTIVTGPAFYLAVGAGI